MADFENDSLAGVFAEFRNEVAPYVRPGGTAAAHETVRGRRRTRAIGGSLLAALLVAAPVAAHAALTDGSHGPPAPPAASQSPTPAPDQPQPSTASSQATTVPTTPAAPDGRISRKELGEATLRLPAWPSDAIVNVCPSGPVKFSGGHHRVEDSIGVWIEKVVHTDVDHDGEQETVARFTCGDQISTFQVVAFDRDAAGAIRTMGQVAAQTGAVKTICDIRVGAAGSVEVHVGDLPTPLRCLEPPASYVQFQWRGYGWDGDRFHQTSGPTGFPVNRKVTDLAVSSTDLVFGPAVDGVRHGSMTVTVRNNGPTALPYQVSIGVPAGLQPVAPGGCKIETYPQPVLDVTCDQASLKAGATRELTFEFTATRTVKPDFLPEAVARLKDGYEDSKPENDRAEFTVKF